MVIREVADADLLERLGQSEGPRTTGVLHLSDIRRHEDLAWAAGLFEGEGCFCVTKPSTKYQTRYFRARLNMTDYDVVFRFRQVMGFGSFLTAPQKNPKHLLQWVWNATSFEQFQATVALLWPWLGERRRATAKRALLLAREYHATRQPRFGWGVTHKRAIAEGKRRAKEKAA